MCRSVVDEVFYSDIHHLHVIAAGNHWHLVPRFSWDTIGLACGLIAIGIPIVNVYVRIIFGHPVAKRNILSGQLDTSLEHRDTCTNNADAPQSPSQSSLLND